MKIHAIQTGSVTIRPSQQIGKGRGLVKMKNILTDKEWTEPLPIYAWAIEHPEGIILVDTGENSRTMEPGYFPTWHPYFKNAKMRVKPEEEIGPQLKNIGINTSDVKHVIMTHLHTDHAGGLSYFPKSKIIIHKGEYKSALGFSGLLKGFPNNRFPSWLSPILFEFNNEKFYSFQQSLKLYDDVIIVPTFGHTGTHISVIVQHDGLNYFLAGDSSYNQQNMLLEKVDGVSLNNGVALNTLKNIKHYTKLNPTIYLPSHDPDSAKRLRKNETVIKHESDLVINQALT